MREAEVSADASARHIIIRARRVEDRSSLRTALKSVGVHPRLVADRFLIDPADAVKLHQQAVSGFQLTWTTDARLMTENRIRMRAIWPRLRTTVAAIRERGVEEAHKYLRGYDKVRPLDNHQLVGVAAMTLPEALGFCLFDEQGVGKTVTVIHAFDLLASKGDVDVMVVVAPKSMLGEWKRAFDTFMRDLYEVVSIDDDQNRHLVFHRGADVVVINFEAARTYQAELRALARRCRGKSLLVVDESFFVKNPNAQRTLALKALREWFGRCWILCGTPAPNSPHDIVAQFDLADLGQTFGGIDIPEDRDAARPVVKATMESRGVFLRSIKSTVLPDLPEKHFNRVWVDFQPVQGAAYAAALNDLVADLRTMDDRTFARELTSVLARRMALLRICSNPEPIVPGYDEVPGKLRALDQILEEMVIKRGEKVVVWSSFTKSLEAILHRYEQFAPVRFDGATDSQEREEAIRRFQRGDAMLFVANPAAAGAGLTLHRARVAVYESLTNQTAHFLQSVDRIHRRGQTRAVEYLVLLMQGSVEVGEFERLQEKQATARELLGDPGDTSVTREGMLTDLLSSQELTDRV